MPKIKRLPQEVFIRIENSDREGDDDFLVADTIITNMANLGYKTKIGVYQLIEVIEAEGVVQTKTVGKGKKKK